MKISQEENDLLKDLVAQFDYPTLDPEKHITAKQMVDAWSVSETCARTRLRDLVSKGKLASERVRLPSGNLCTGFYKPE